jgi:hypothetical protein
LEVLEQIEPVRKYARNTYAFHDGGVVRAPQRAAPSSAALKRRQLSTSFMDASVTLPDDVVRRLRHGGAETSTTLSLFEQLRRARRFSSWRTATPGCGPSKA